MPTDNIFERRANVLTGIVKRRQEFADEFLGAGQRPPFTHKLNRNEKRQYFWAQPVEKQVDMWSKMDEAERDIILGNDKPTGEEKAQELMGYGG